MSSVRSCQKSKEEHGYDSSIGKGIKATVIVGHQLTKGGNKRNQVYKQNSLVDLASVISNVKSLMSSSVHATCSISTDNQATNVQANTNSNFQEQNLSSFSYSDGTAIKNSSNSESTKKTMNKTKEKHNLWIKEKNVQPENQSQVLSFSREQKNKTVFFSVEEDGGSMSTPSCRPSEDSDESSDIESEDEDISKQFPPITSERYLSALEPIHPQLTTPTERFISVYWDIENCAVPHNKSVIDIVKKIRDTLYEGRTEESFRVACDIRKLDPVIDRELGECDVTVIHANSLDKNAADAKLQRFLLQYQHQYRNRDAAIVLISGDSDFSNFLYDMRYKHHIHVNLICNSHARKALRDAAHRCILFKDFVKDLPHRPTSESNQYVIVSKFPYNIQNDVVKTFLMEKLKSCNCRVNLVSPTQAEIMCSNDATLHKSLDIIKGATINGVPLSITHEVRNTLQNDAALKNFIDNANENSIVEPIHTVNEAKTCHTSEQKLIKDSKEGTNMIKQIPITEDATKKKKTTKKDITTEQNPVSNSKNSDIDGKPLSIIETVIQSNDIAAVQNLITVGQVPIKGSKNDNITVRPILKVESTTKNKNAKKDAAQKNPVSNSQNKNTIGQNKFTAKTEMPKKNTAVTQTPNTDGKTGILTVPVAKTSTKKDVAFKKILTSNSKGNITIEPVLKVENTSKKKNAKKYAGEQNPVSNSQNKNAIDHKKFTAKTERPKQNIAVTQTPNKGDKTVSQAVPMAKTATKKYVAVEKNPTSSSKGGGTAVLPEIETKAVKKKRRRKKNKGVQSEANVTKENATAAKIVALQVYVSFKHGNTDYWLQEFTKMFQNNDITAQWCTGNRISYFIIKFQSVSKAQKARKVLEKAQNNDTTAPKFLKLIKNEADGLNLDTTLQTSMKDLTLQKIRNQIQHILAKKKNSLEKFQICVKNLKEGHKTCKTSDAVALNLALSKRHEELNQQKMVFLNFTEGTCARLKNLDINAEDIDKSINNIILDYYQECACFELCLPIYAKKTIILKKVKTYQVVIIECDPDFGKATQICCYLYRTDFTSNGIILCTEPSQINSTFSAKCSAIQMASYESSVGYRVGFTKSIPEKTKILYTTDYMLLQMCSDDPLLSKISCIVIDEAQERSIYTDLAAGIIKQLLTKRKDLKLIITCKPLKVNVFQKYFSLSEDAILRFSRQTYPIEDIWLDGSVMLGANYLEKCMEVTFDILQEEPGDVLVFLCTRIETEKAVESFKQLLNTRKCNSKVLILLLHDKLGLEEQQKLLEKTPEGTRKIVFATNRAETLMSIPGIRYVVDSGITEEVRNDVIRNTDVLIMDFISQYSADQRRNQAGRTQCGKCYRIYSQSNYKKDMAENATPEILKINLERGLLTLMKVGINPLEFDFVESPTRESLTSALQQLVHLGAVDNLSLTPLGMQLATLPIEPSLGHLILKGIQLQIGYEAVVIASIATLSQDIFFQNACKRKKDFKNSAFCRPESDFLTFLDIFKEWTEMPKSSKDRWCQSNLISKRSMNYVQELINELLQILWKSLKTKILPKYSTDDKLYRNLLKIIFESFSENISVFSSENKLGYISLHSEDVLRIHPSSSLCALGSDYPSYIVYDRILKTTSELFLLNASVITENFVEEAQRTGLIINLPKLKTSLKPFTFQGIGKTVLQELFGSSGGNLKDLDTTLINLCDGEYCSVEVDFQSGCFTVYSFPKFHPIIGQVFSSCIQIVHAKLVEQEFIVPDILGINGCSAVFKAGGRINEVVLPGESRDVIVKPAKCETSVIKNTLEMFGRITHVKEFKTCKVAVFETVASAEMAVKTSTKGTGFEITPGKSYVNQERDPFFKIHLSAARRPCTGRASFSVSPITSLAIVCDMLKSKELWFKSKQISIDINKKYPNDLCIHNLPANFMESELKSFIMFHLPDDISLSRVVVKRQIPFPSNDADSDGIAKQITNIFSIFSPRDKIIVKLKPSEPTDTEWKAIIFFNNSHDGQNAVNFLNSDCKLSHFEFCDVILRMKSHLETSLHCSKEVYKAMEEQIASALKSFENDGGNNELKINGNYSVDGKRVIINIESDSLADILHAKKEIEQLIQGVQINYSHNTFSKELFTLKGKAVLKKIMSEVGKSYITFNGSNRVVSLFGRASKCAIIKARIDDYLQDLAQEQNNSCQLSLTYNKTSVLNEVIKKYGLDLGILSSSCSLTLATVEFHSRFLKISGPQSSIVQCQNVIRGMIHKLMETPFHSEAAEVCALCMAEVAHPFYRLEFCGHAYCEQCILFQIHNDERIPIVCCAQNCNQVIVVNDIHWTWKKLGNAMEVFWRRALEVFMKGNPSVRYCPTSGCSMLHRVAKTEKARRKICLSCKNEICTKCGVLYHVGFSCDLYQSMQADDDVALKLWASKDPAKRRFCPSCKAPIETEGSCMHMSCWKCQCYMCWKCMKLFPTAVVAYLHQYTCSKSQK